MESWFDQIAQEVREAVVGRTIVEVRTLTAGERENVWQDGDGDETLVFVLDDGQMLVPIADAEGSLPGRMWLREPDAHVH